MFERMGSLVSKLKGLLSVADEPSLKALAGLGAAEQWPVLRPPLGFTTVVDTNNYSPHALKPGL